MTILNPLAAPTEQGHPNGESPAVGEPADRPSVARSDGTGELTGRIRLALGGRPTSGPPLPGRSNLGLPAETRSAGGIRR